MIKRVVNYLRYNNEKKMTLQIYGYVTFYRLCILLLPMTVVEKMMGIRGEESSAKESMEHYKFAKRVSIHVNRVTQHLPLKRKCWVRALTARKLLMRHGLNSTLYMGVGRDENGAMIAHAWLRCGEMSVTGEAGEGYTMVAKFKAF